MIGGPETLEIEGAARGVALAALVPVLAPLPLPSDAP